jgi:hypothetical protein
MAISRMLAPAMLLLALAGCGSLEGGAAGAPPPAPNAVRRGSEVGGRFISLVGPRRQFAAPFLGVPGTNFSLLRSWIDTRNAQRLTQLYVEDSYSGAERGYDAAHDGDGTVLKFVPISRNEITCDNGNCSYAAEFAADLPEPLMQAHRQGLTVVFSAKSGPELSIAVPGDLIAKQLAALDDTAATLPAATAGPPAAKPPQ